MTRLGYGTGQGGMGSNSVRFGWGEAMQQSPIAMLEMRAVVTGCTVVTRTGRDRWRRHEVQER